MVNNTSTCTNVRKLAFNMFERVVSRSYWPSDEKIS